VKRALVLAVLSVALALLGIAVACGSNPITVATIEVGAKCEITDAGDAGEPCPTGQFCSTPTTLCESKDAAVCEPIGEDACASSGPECGCDGISYYNECLRQSAHVSLKSAGPCTFSAAPCGPQISCPVDSASCARILEVVLPSFGDVGPELGDASREFLGDAAPSCATFEQGLARVFGACWVLPESCPSPASRTVVGVCDPKCIDDCSAIRDGGLYTLCPPDASAN
jgi:hypothetical protein